jgi:hypothetical protein
MRLALEGQYLDPLPFSRMKICAALAWYDEPIEFLDRCVRSLAGVMDFLVAVDGPWQGFPHDRVLSDPAQSAAIMAAAVDVGLPFAIIERGAAWDSQVAKRDHLMHESSACSDWIFVIDGDEHVHQAHAETTRTALDSAATDVGTVVCRHVTGHQADRFSAPIRRLYRAGTTVEQAHNGYRYGDKWLHGDPSYVKLEQPFVTPLTIHHQRSDRGEQRNQAAMDYRAYRRAQRTEAWNLRLDRGSTP